MTWAAAATTATGSGDTTTPTHEYIILQCSINKPPRADGVKSVL